MRQKYFGFLPQVVPNEKEICKYKLCMSISLYEMGVFNIFFCYK